MRHEGGRHLDYAKPLVRKRRPFLARPFWRDYLLAYACIGFGILLGDGGAPPGASGRLIVLGVAAVVGGAGLLIFCCAVGHSVWSLVRRSGGAT